MDLEPDTDRVKVKDNDHDKCEFEPFKANKLLCLKMGDGLKTAQLHHDELLPSNDLSFRFDDDDEVTQRSSKDLSMINDDDLSISRCPEHSVNSVTQIIENFNFRLARHLPNAKVTSDGLKDNIKHRKQDYIKCKGLNTELDKDTKMQSNSELDKVFERLKGSKSLKQALKISPKKTQTAELIKINRLENSPKSDKKNEPRSINEVLRCNRKSNSIKKIEPNRVKLMVRQLEIPDKNTSPSPRRKLKVIKDKKKSTRNDTTSNQPQITTFLKKE